MLNEARKLKREELIMKRRGLNFVTEGAAEHMDEEQLEVLESEVDNIAPKVVGILALSESCDVKELRLEMVKHCIEYQLSQQPGNKATSEELLAADT